MGNVNEIYIQTVSRFIRIVANVVADGKADG
jgi:hypothetical protein